MTALMEKYKDIPMDLADASLVAVAKSRSLRRIFSIENDLFIYFIYRLSDAAALEAVRSRNGHSLEYTDAKQTTRP